VFSRAAFRLQEMGHGTDIFLTFVLLCLQKFCRKTNKGHTQWIQKTDDGSS